MTDTRSTHELLCKLRSRTGGKPEATGGYVPRWATTENALPTETPRDLIPVQSSIGAGVHDGVAYDFMPGQVVEINAWAEAVLGYRPQRTFHAYSSQPRSDYARPDACGMHLWWFKTADDALLFKTVFVDWAH